MLRESKELKWRIMTNCGENTMFSGKHKPTARQATTQCTHSTAKVMIKTFRRLSINGIYLDLPICSPWTFRENHSPNIIYTVNRRNQPTAMDLYFLDLVRTRYKTEPETHTKSAHTVL